MTPATDAQIEVRDISRIGAESDVVGSHLVAYGTDRDGRSVRVALRLDDGAAAHVSRRLAAAARGADRGAVRRRARAAADPRGGGE